MKAYRVTGMIPLGSITQKFTQDVVAKSKEEAEHKVLSNLGGRHKINRRQISIESNKEIKPSQSQNPMVQNQFREQIASASEEE